MPMFHHLTAVHVHLILLVLLESFVDIWDVDFHTPFEEHLNTRPH